MYQSKLTISAAGTYNGCYLTVRDRQNNTSNALPLGNFTATMSPYDICNHPDRTVPQSECTALMDLYTSTNGASWSQKAGW